MKTLIKTSFISALLLVSTHALSFGLGDLTSAVKNVGDLAGAVKNIGGPAETVKNKETASSVDTYAAQDGLVKQYTKAAIDIMDAQKMFAGALGLKKEAAALAEEVEALKSGAVVDADAMERASETSDSAQDAILAATEDSDELSDEAKKSFAKAFVPYFSGLYETSKISDSASDFMAGAKSTISSASFMNKLKVTKKLSAGMYVAKEMPGFASNLYKSSKTLVSFAESQGIDVPDDANMEISFN